MNSLIYILISNRILHFNRALLYGFKSYIPTMKFLKNKKKVPDLLMAEGEEEDEEEKKSREAVNKPYL